MSIITFCLTVLIQAQSNPIDALFNKYSEKEGFTVVSISGKMFSMFTDDGNNDNPDNVVSKLKSIRILSVSDSLLNKDLNFYNELTQKLDLSVYEELMVVKEGRDITKFLIKQKKNVISELLVISGGPDGNSLISIRGEFNLKNILGLSKDLGLEELKDLEKVDNKKR